LRIAVDVVDKVAQSTPVMASNKRRDHPPPTRGGNGVIDPESLPSPLLHRRRRTEEGNGQIAALPRDDQRNAGHQKRSIGETRHGCTQDGGQFKRYFAHL
jgi:hypothetical protein